MSAQVQRLLVRTLYTQPTSLAIGAINGIVSSAVAAWLTNSPLLWVGCVALSLVAVARVTAAFGLSPDDSGRSTRQLELVYETGAFSYAFLLGALAGITILIEASAPVQVLMVANAMGYGIGICARNAGRPTIALGQLFLTSLPVMSAAFIEGSVAMLLFGANMVLLVPAMASITINVFTVLRQSFAQAEKSAKLAEEMQILARTDVVTGLANRAGLNHQLEELVAGMEPDQMFAMFWLDLDHFKEVNDILGHTTGDDLLRQVSERLTAYAPDGSIISRFGGDEFVVVAEVKHRADCEMLAGVLQQELSRSYALAEDRVQVGSSMGIALMPEDSKDLHGLMQAADLALYHAKINGRNQANFFTPSMTRELVRRKEIEAELRAAIQKDELSIFFQPIVDLETGRIRTFEALVRWFHPEKGELRPDEFIPVAEETGVIITLGNWITAQAAKACAQWPEDVTIAVNLSPAQIKAPGAALGILSALREARLDPSRLELEVTESLFLDDSETTTNFIEELASQGVRFALDDFGTGYSSLGYINKFPFKKIKVDRSFVSGDHAGGKSEAIIHAVAEMGARLGMDIVAEGIETIEQVRSVRELGCTLGQGYYFSRAVPDYLAAMLLAQERESEHGLRQVG
ncbi:MAG: EAL domain-containing protein [Sphingomonadales bacterium]|nr:EAL domain-containing protein [Sphingomonadales bacterium]MBD3774860.1 EAL domain-containing protein [Paracoccaceae bacterium]